MRSLFAIVEASSLVNGVDVDHKGLCILFGAALWVVCLFVWGGNTEERGGTPQCGPAGGHARDHHGDHPYQNETHIPRGVRGGCEKVISHRSLVVRPAQGPGGAVAQGTAMECLNHWNP